VQGNSRHAEARKQDPDSSCEVIQDALETQDKAKLGTITRTLQGIQKETNWKGGGRKESIRRETTREGAEGGSLLKGR
jgi:hypothetical protein